MAAVEIDEVELLRLQKQDKTVHALLANPKAKRKIFEAYKEHDPNVRIPELEVEEAARAPVMELEKKFEALTKELGEERAKREQAEKLGQLNGAIDSGMANLRRAGWTDEGLVEIRKVMDEKGILDPEVAAAYYEKQHPPQEPVTPRGHGGWNFVENVQDGEKDLQALLNSKGQSESLADKMARETLQELRGASRR